MPESKDRIKGAASSRRVCWSSVLWLEIPVGADRPAPGLTLREAEKRVRRSCGGGILSLVRHQLPEHFRVLVWKTKVSQALSALSPWPRVAVPVTRCGKRATHPLEMPIQWEWC